MTDVVQRVAAAGHALAGRVLEARQTMARLCAFDPLLRLSNLAEVLPPFYRPDDRSRYIEGLRKAGLPAKRRVSAKRRLAYVGFGTKSRRSVSLNAKVGKWRCRAGRRIGLDYTAMQCSTFQSGGFLPPELSTGM
ncbi:hypothetical protein [Mesorhizobium sp.]|uniref:hypothetical protein n=2 Tax=Phyllobacteriaceae TaxID=69277 RepID=UPI00257BE363|nr:hypothetical protein [Mesorhizobium sp.]